MRIRSNAPKVEHSQSPRKSMQKSQPRKEIKDEVNLSDGINTPIEALMLPSMDASIIPAALQLKGGTKLVVEGSCKKKGEEVSKINYEVSTDPETGEVVAKGKIIDPKTKKGVFIEERFQKSPKPSKPSQPINVKKFLIEGSVSDKESKKKNEHLDVKIILGMSPEGYRLAGSAKGKIGDLPVTQRVEINPDPFEGYVHSKGNIMGVPFSTKIAFGQDYAEDGTIKITGNVGEKKLEGAFKEAEDGSIIVEKQVGEYHLVENLRFIDK